MPQRLFIGGYADGRWIDVKDYVSHFEVVEFPEIDINSITKDFTLQQETKVNITRHLYKLESIYFNPNHVESFYILNTMTPLEAFLKLLEGYHAT